MRMAVWHAGNTISNIISGFLAAGILHHMGGIAGLYSWQWFFIIEGAASILVGVIAFFVLPDWPENTRWLTEEEREMAQYRVLLSNGGKEEQVGGTWDGLKEACKDPFTWMFCGMHFSLINAQSFKDFFPSVSCKASRQSSSKPSTIILTFCVDHQDFRILRARDVPGPGSAIRDCLHLRVSSRLELWQIPRVLLSHRRPDRDLSRRHLHHDLDSEHRRPLLWSRPVGQRHVQRPQLAAELGDDLGPGTPKQESGADCHCQLREPMLSLVFTILFPHCARAVLQAWRRSNPLWLPLHCAALLWRQAVG